MIKTKLLFGILIFIIAGVLIAGVAIAWTNPTAAPPGDSGALYFSGTNVGIATTTPSYKLTVSGNIYATGNITCGGTCGGTSVNASGVSAGVFGSVAGKGNYTFQAAVNTNPVLFVDATNERVGIGTAGPQRKLHITSLTDRGSNSIFQSDADGRGGIVIRDQYPNIDIVSNIYTNTNHGPTLGFVAYNGDGSQWGRWVMGTSGVKGGMLSIGYAADLANPHYGIGWGWGGDSYTKMTLDTSGNMNLRWGSLNVAGTILATGGTIYNGNTTRRWVTDGAWNTFYTDSGYISLGPANAGWAHIYSDKNFYFNQNLYINGTQVVYNSGTWGINITGSATTASNASACSVDGSCEMYTMQPVGVGGDSGRGAESYAIFQEGGAWAHPYPDLRIAYHTGIKLGAHYSYNGIRFYNNSDMVTETMSVGNTDNNVRVAYDLYVGSAGRWFSTISSWLNQSVVSGANVTFGEVYSNSWLRNNQNLTGLYNQAVGAHFYASAANVWNMGGGGTYPQLILRDNHQSTIRGYVYSDATGFGLLNNAGSWMFYSPTNNTNVYFPAWGNWISSAATHRGEGTNFVDYAYGLYDAYRGGWRTSNDLYVAYAYSAGNADTVDGLHGTSFSSPVCTFCLTCGGTWPSRQGSTYALCGRGTDTCLTRGASCAGNQYIQGTDGRLDFCCK